jgi:putative molybdopterin biosynthesis protein
MSEKREFLDLISVEEAQKLILKNYSWKPSNEIVALKNVRGRILAKDVTAPIDTPPFDRSRMDGFAVRAKDTFDIDETNPKTFNIIDSVPAGSVSQKTLENPFTCIEIATGAPIPYGATAVVMVEYTSRKSENEIEIFRPATSYENIDPSGSDIMYGETVLREGDELTPVRAGILAALGLERVEVKTKLKIGILSSGDELKSPGEDLTPGSLYDSNSFVLTSLVEENGAHAIPLGICPDNLEILKKTLLKHLRDLDIIIISGGTSAGEGDYSYRVITELKGSLLYHGVSMKPGKPLAAGIINERLVITLPGFPASAIFSFNTVIAPLLRQWTKHTVELNQKVQAIINQRIRSTPGRKQFKLVHVMKKGKEYYAYPVRGTSGSVSMLERADGYITIPEDVDFLNPGDNVTITLLRDKLSVPDLVFIGSHDFLIDYLFKKFRQKYPEYNTKVIYTGSTRGLSAIRNGECDIAGIHLLDENTKQYNTPFIDSWKLNELVTLIKGYTRHQGLYIQKGNPKKITDIKDLIRPDLSFLNRNEGSGTRILLDFLLRDLNLHNQKEKIHGYSSIAYSHSATASAVVRGKVDVSIGINSYAKHFGIDFIPLAKEQYDFLINNYSYEKIAVEKILELFSSDEFRQDVESKLERIKWSK